MNNYAGEYDRVYSLGSNCIVKHSMRYAFLAGSSSPFDWWAWLDLEKILNLISNDFKDLFLKENFHQMNIGHGDEFMKIVDVKNQINSFHDFREENNSIDNMPIYPSFQMRVKRNVSTFLEEIRNEEKVLFLADLNTNIPKTRPYCERSNMRYDYFLVRLMAELYRLRGYKPFELVAVTYFKELESLNIPGLTIKVLDNCDSFTEERPFNLYDPVIHDFWADLLKGITIKDESLRVGFKHERKAKCNA